MDVRDLKVFETVARCQSINRAAMELNTVQSNVTARVRMLETELGVSLFERRPSGMKLTVAGERLLPYAFEVRAVISNAKRAIADAGVPGGQLLIGMRKSTSAMHLTNLLSSYLAAHPQVDVQIHTENSLALVNMVLERRLDGAFVCSIGEHRDLVGETVFDEELVVISGPDVEDLAELAADARMILLGQGSIYQPQLEAVLARQGIAAPRVMELGTLENLMGCVSAGLGVTLLPIGVVKAFSGTKVRMHRVADEDCRVQTVFVRRRDGYVSSTLSSFIANARAYSRGLKPADASFAPHLAQLCAG